MSYRIRTPRGERPAMRLEGNGWPTLVEAGYCNGHDTVPYFILGVYDRAECAVCRRELATERLGA